MEAVPQPGRTAILETHRRPITSTIRQLIGSKLGNAVPLIAELRQLITYLQLFANLLICGHFKSLLSGYKPLKVQLRSPKSLVQGWEDL